MNNPAPLVPPPPPIGHNNPPPAPPAPNMQRDLLLTAWQTIKTRMAQDKDEEKKLRAQIVEMEFKGAKTGTNRVPLGNGWMLKAVINLTYKITKNEAVEPPDYSHIPGILAQLPPAVAQGLIKWTPELSESAYKQLTEEERKIVNQMLVITNGSSTIDIEAPKTKPAAG